MAPTERVAERLASRVFGTELSRETRQRLGLGIYWTYGAFWGALSAQLQETFQPPALYHGALLGLGVWLIGPMRLIPALGLYERPAFGQPGSARCSRSVCTCCTAGQRRSRISRSPGPVGVPTFCKPFAITTA